MNDERRGRWQRLLPRLKAASEALAGAESELESSARECCEAQGAVDAHEFNRLLATSRRVEKSKTRRFRAGQSLRDLDIQRDPFGPAGHN